MGKGTPNGALLRYLNAEVIPFDGEECLIWPFSRAGNGYAQVRVAGVRRQWRSSKMTDRFKVIISSITPRGVEPQFFAELPTKARANEYEREFKKLAAKAGVMIRIDHEITPSDLLLARYQIRSAEAARQRVLDEDARDTEWATVEERARTSIVKGI